MYVPICIENNIERTAERERESDLFSMREQKRKRKKTRREKGKNERAKRYNTTQHNTLQQAIRLGEDDDEEEEKLIPTASALKSQTLNITGC